MEALSLSITSILLEDGNYLNYFNGDDIDLDCGIYYLVIQIGTDTWYSDLFKILDISGQSTVPEIKYKDVHLPLPIYNSIYKQNRYNCGDECNSLLISPVNQITPFFTDIVTFVNSSEVQIYLVDVATNSEVEITGDLNLVFGSNWIYSHGGNFVQFLYCGLYYLRIHSNSGDWYSELFKVLDLTGLVIPESKCYLTDEDGNFILTESGEKIIIDCFNFTNADKSQVFTKNDCAVGYIGTNVTYTVPSGTYTSTISQADADQQALDDIAANGQAYANANGTCTLIPNPIVFFDQFSSSSELVNYSEAVGSVGTIVFSIDNGALKITETAQGVPWSSPRIRRTVDLSGETIGNNYRLSFDVIANNTNHDTPILIMGNLIHDNLTVGFKTFDFACLSISNNYIQIYPTAVNIMPALIDFKIDNLKLIRL